MKCDGFDENFGEIEKQMGRELVSVRVPRKGSTAAASHCEEDGDVADQ
jgi:hypothetical protein